MKSCDTYEVYIYCGLKEGYDGQMHTLDEVIAICQKFCEIGYGVMVAPTHFVYTGGNEPGFYVSLINQPRFPSTHDTVLDKAIDLGKILLVALKQKYVTVCANWETYVIEDADCYQQACDSEQQENGAA